VEFKTYIINFCIVLNAQVLEALMERPDRRVVIVDVESVDVLKKVMAQAQEVKKILFIYFYFYS